MSEWKLVPEEPTQEMIEAGFAAIPGLLEGRIRAQWRRMLATAPQPPSHWPASRPMSEAPKDAVVLAWWPADKQWVVTWWWSQRSGWFCRGYAPPGKPTCWLPMPAAPADQQEKTT